MKANLRFFLLLAIIATGVFASAAHAQTSADPSERIGVDASDPYSEQVYSGSQETDAVSESTPASSMNNDMMGTTSQMQQNQSLPRFYQMRLETLDRGSR